MRQMPEYIKLWRINYGNFLGNPNAEGKSEVAA